MSQSWNGAADTTCGTTASIFPLLGLQPKGSGIGPLAVQLFGFSFLESHKIRFDYVFDPLTSK